ncbi:MAG: HAD family hydrolase [Planctomycetota bacterium]|jgi:FMN phosphatase YigB (HAD superfamily)
MFSAIRLILFDLDDTLFDCAGTLVPQAHRDAVAAMVAAGLPGPAEERGEELLRILEVTPGTDAYATLCERHECPAATIVEAGKRTFYDRDVPPIEPFPGVRELLDGLAGRMHRVIVTRGVAATQQRKVARLGLAPHVDGVIYVDTADAGGKQAAFAACMAEQSVPAAQTLVVGNRRSDEIAAGNRLGCRTALVVTGEYAGAAPAGPEESAEAELQRIADLAALLA